MKGPMVWIIDDDMVAQFAATYKIGQSYPDHRVICHDSIEAALTAIEQCMNGKGCIPDMVLLDLSFPMLDGWYFLEALEKNGKAVAAIEVFILSAFSNSKDRIRAKGHPLVKGHFDKPISGANLDSVFGAGR